MRYLCRNTLDFGGIYHLFWVEADLWQLNQAEIKKKEREKMYWTRGKITAYLIALDCPISLVCMEMERVILRSGGNLMFFPYGHKVLRRKISLLMENKV